MEAKKTKTGKWTCCAYYKDADGIIRRPRFTADRKKDAERMAEACVIERFPVIGKPYPRGITRGFEFAE